MPEVPAGLTDFFLAQVGGLSLLAVVAMHVAGRRLGEYAPDTWHWTAGTALFLLAYLGATAALAISGVLTEFERVPPPLMVTFAAASMLTIALAVGPPGGRLIAGIGLPWLIGYQAFRIAVELFLVWTYRAGALPVQMTVDGLNFDVLTGLSALLVALLAAAGWLPRALLWIWNLAGLGLLTTIVTIAVFSFPTPFRGFDNEPANVIVAHVPFMWLPLFLVQAALFGHVLVFRSLLSPR